MFPWRSPLCLCLTAEVSRPQAVTQTDDVTDRSLLTPCVLSAAACLCLYERESECTWIVSYVFVLCNTVCAACISIWMFIHVCMIRVVYCVCLFVCVCSDLCLFALVLNFSQPCVLLLLITDTVTQQHPRTLKKIYILSVSLNLFMNCMCPCLFPYIN